MDFAAPTVAVDVLVSLTAMGSVLLLHHNNPKGRILAIFTIILGILHIVISGYAAPTYKFAEHLNAQWFIPVTLGPIMLVSLFLSCAVLLKKADDNTI